MNDGLIKAREAAKERKRLGIKLVIKNPIEKAREHPESLRKAITAMCFDCVGAGYDPDWRGSVRNCHCNNCPLWTVRPYRIKVDKCHETNS